MKEGGEGGNRGGAKRRRKNNLGTSWQTYRNIKGGGGLVGRLSCSRTRNGREGEEWVGFWHAGTETRDAQVVG